MKIEFTNYFRSKNEIRIFFLPVFAADMDLWKERDEYYLLIAFLFWGIVIKYHKKK